MKHIGLRPIQASDTLDIVRWRNDNSVRANLFSQEELTVEQHMEWVKNVIKTKKAYQFIIEEMEGPNIKKIGTTFLKNIDYCNKKAEFGIFIGNKDSRGNGYGTIATKKTLEFGFKNLGLNRIYSNILETNKASITALINGGMKQEGLLREDYIRDNKTFHVIISAITREDWDNKAIQEENSNE